MVVSISQAAAVIGVLTVRSKTLRRWLQKGYLNSDSRTIGGHRRYALESLEKFETSS